ncbi:MAG: dihydroxyacetone kinase subunit DhaK, partial [Anaerolineales bacterium]
MLAEDEMGVGMGIHGEPGIEISKLKTADEIAETILSKLINDMPFSQKDEVVALVNGLGATCLEELY